MPKGKQASESQEQQALFEWAELMDERHPELRLMYHIPNGGKRHIATAKRLKAEGVKRGVPDIFLPVARKSFHGLYIEMKSKTGKLSDEQREWCEDLAIQGYAVKVCRGWESAVEVILKYLGAS